MVEKIEKTKKFGPGFGKAPIYTRRRPANKKIAALKQQKSRRVITKQGEKDKLVAEIAKVKNLPKDIENILQKKANIPMNAKIKKDIELSKKLREIHVKYNYKKKQAKESDQSLRAPVFVLKEYHLYP